ncbi:hypothetical protein D3C86_2231000 [compost metagenome]
MSDAIRRAVSMRCGMGSVLSATVFFRSSMRLYAGVITCAVASSQFMRSAQSLLLRKLIQYEA